MLMTTFLFSVGSCLPFCKALFIRLLLLAVNSDHRNRSVTPTSSLCQFSSFLISHNHLDSVEAAALRVIIAMTLPRLRSTRGFCSDRQFFFRGDILLGPLLGDPSVQAICAITTRLLLTHV